MTAREHLCLPVHENQECAIHLVRNLRYLDPDSLLLFIMAAVTAVCSIRLLSLEMRSYRSSPAAARARGRLIRLHWTACVSRSITSFSAHSRLWIPISGDALGLFGPLAAFLNGRSGSG